MITIYNATICFKSHNKKKTRKKPVKTGKNIQIIKCICFYGISVEIQDVSYVIWSKCQQSVLVTNDLNK